MLENISENVKALTIKLDPVPGALLTIQNTLTNLINTVGGHDVTLYGEKNDNGLVGEVSSLKKDFDKFRDQDKDFKNAVKWVAGIVLTLIIGTMYMVFTGQLKLVAP